MSDAATARSSPRLEARRRAFLDAATAAFLEKGYASATLDDVIARSGGSRQTLYSLFGGKQGLFEALVAERTASIFAPYPADTLRDRAPQEVLIDLGVRYLEVVTTPDALGVYRLVVAEGSTMQVIAEKFWKMGPSRSRGLIAEYMAEQARRGTLRVDNADEAAAQFTGMLLGNFHLECLLGLRAAPDRVTIEGYVRSAVQNFLKGCET